MAKLRTILAIAPLDTLSVDAALARRLRDIEDGFQPEAAMAWKATHFITRNTKDFPQDTSLLIKTPTDYLRP